MKKPNVKTVLLAAVSAFILFACSGTDRKTEPVNKKDLKEQIKQNKYCPDGYEALFTHGNLHDFEIVISGKEWRGLIQDMKNYMRWDKSRKPRTGKYRTADMIYRGPSGAAEISKVGFRTKGNFSRPFPQDEHGLFHRAHFKIKINKRFEQKEGSAEYIIRKERRFCTMREIELRACFQKPQGDSTLIRELFSYDLLNKAGVTTCRTGSARLTITIDGKKHYFGLFTIVEQIDKSFLTRRFGKDGNDGNLYKCLWGDSGPATLQPVDERFTKSRLFPQKKVIGSKNWKKHYRPTYDLKTNEDEADNSALLDFINNLNSLDLKQLKEYLDANFEIDRFLRYQAMNVLLGKWDDYWAMGNNYYLYVHNSGKIEFLPVDYDMCLGAGFMLFDPADIGIYDWKNRCRDYLAMVAPQIPRRWLEKYADYSSPLTERIFKIEEYRTKYEQYLKDFITPENNLFLYSEFRKKFELLEQVYEPHLANDLREDMIMRDKASAKTYFNTKTKSIIRQLGLNESGYELF